VVDIRFTPDHQDSPNAWDSGIRYFGSLAFTIPEQPSHLVLIMNTQPLASESAWFSDAFDYSIAATCQYWRDWICNSQQASRSFVSPAISRHQAPDAGRAQMTVKTWYSEELAGSI